MVGPLIDELSADPVLRQYASSMERILGLHAALTRRGVGEAHAHAIVTNVVQEVHSELIESAIESIDSMKVAVVDVVNNIAGDIAGVADPLNDMKRSLEGIHEAALN